MRYSNVPPPGLSIFSDVAQTQSTGVRHSLDTLNTNVVYACLGANEFVLLDAGPKYSFGLPSGFDTGQAAYYAAIYQSPSWVGGYGGPGTLLATASSTTVSMTGRFGFAIPANGQVCVALYARLRSAPTPAPATAGLVSVDSAKLTFTTNAQQTIHAAETGYSGAFSATSANTAIATVTPGAASGQFVVTPVGVGTTTITIAAGMSIATVAVVVTAFTPVAVPTSSASSSPAPIPSSSPSSSPVPVPTASQTPLPVPSPVPSVVPTIRASPSPVPTPVPTSATGETFSGSSTTQNAWQFGGAACLTAGSTSTTASTSVPACGPSASDALGSGTLRLTTNAANQTGFVVSKTAILTNGGGVSVTFDYFAYDGNGADGLSFFLLDANAPLPVAAGASGSGLGYGPARGTPGIANAYLGVGLDSYGNFSTSNSGIPGGPSGGPGLVAQTVAVRGAAATNYKYIGGYTVANSASHLPIRLDSPGTTRPAALHVETTVNSRQNTVTVTIGGTAYISAMSIAGSGQPSFPSKIYLGFAASTGSSTDLHQIRNVTITALP